MAISNEYIERLKRESGCSWKDLERLTGYPSSTIRDHLTGKTTKTDMDILIAAVSAMGGDPAMIGPVSPRLRADLDTVRRVESEESADESAFRTALDALQRAKAELLDLQRASYERELSSLRSERNGFRRALIVVSAIMVVLMFATIMTLLYDLTHLDRGWITAIYGIGSRSFGFGSALRSILKGWFHV